MKTIHRRLATLILTAVLLIAGSGLLLAIWTPTGNPVCTATGTQDFHDMIPAGGGAMMVWQDTRNGNLDVFAQGLSAVGDPRWAADGIALCTNGSEQVNPKIVYEGPGAFKAAYYAAVWQDSRNGNHDIYAQCFTNFGILVYPTDGTPIASGVGDQESHQLASGGGGTNYVVWTDVQVASQDIYAQAFNHTSTTLWGAGGLPICTAAGVQSGAHVVADGASGGAIFVWQDQRSGVGIYAQKVDAAGHVLWTADGVFVRKGPPYTFSGPVQIVSDGVGGAIILWFEFKGGSENDLYAQRIDASGNQVWGANGEVVCAATGSRILGTARMIPDGSEGAFVVWNDTRNPQQPDVYAQRISYAGFLYWAADGVPVSTATYPQNTPDLAPDGLGGIVVTWTDLRAMGPSDIYAQRLDGAGNPIWATDGIELLNNAYMQIFPRIVNDTRGGSIIAWKDGRNGNDDLYAIRIENELGYTGYPAPTIASVTDVPADDGGFVTVNWNSGDAPFDYYDIYRAIITVSASADGGESPTIKGESFPERAGCPNGYTWQYMNTVTATGAPLYSVAVPTTADSSSAPINTWFNYFMVIGYTTGVGDPFTSCPGFGYSVDNLGPPAPQLWAQRNGGPVDLTYTRTAGDISQFIIYRSTIPDFPIETSTLVGAPPDTTFQDTGAPPGPLYYRVQGLDIHGNFGDPSAAVGVDVLTGIDGPSRLTSLALGGNAPNPFSSGTMLRVASPATRDATLEVFDVAGRRVRTSRFALHEGWQNVSFDGNDDAGRHLASGVYFYRIRSGVEVKTSKMIIRR